MRSSQTEPEGAPRSCSRGWAAGARRLGGPGSSSPSDREPLAPPTGCNAIPVVAEPEAAAPSRGKGVFPSPSCPAPAKVCKCLLNLISVGDGPAGGRGPGRALRGKPPPDRSPPGGPSPSGPRTPSRSDPGPRSPPSPPPGDSAPRAGSQERLREPREPAQQGLSPRGVVSPFKPRGRSHALRGHPPRASPVCVSVCQVGIPAPSRPCSGAAVTSALILFYFFASGHAVPGSVGVFPSVNVLSGVFLS